MQKSDGSELLKIVQSIINPSYIDHQFLFEILAKRIGLQSVVLLFIKNYLWHRSQQVIIN